MKKSVSGRANVSTNTGSPSRRTNGSLLVRKSSYAASAMITPRSKSECASAVPAAYDPVRNAAATRASAAHAATNRSITGEVVNFETTFVAVEAVVKHRLHAGL
jgi:hypothetical protein